MTDSEHGVDDADVALPSPGLKSESNDVPGSGGAGTHPCVVVGTVMDGGVSSDLRVCRARARTAVVYSSRTNQIDIAFLDSELVTTRNDFLLKYQGQSLTALPFVSLVRRRSRDEVGRT